VQTFTVTFPGHGAFDEARHARLVAAAIGSRHLELPIEPASVDLLPVLAHHFDEPIADSSMLPTYLLSRLVRRHVTVALGGDGGDELFGGYPHYQWLRWQERARRWMPSGLRGAVSRLAAHLPPGTRGRNHGVGLRGSIGWALAHVNVYFDASLRRRLLAPALARRVNDLLAPERVRAGEAMPGVSLLQRATRTDFSTYLADDLLVKVDRASMAHALEVRAPWLMPAIIDFAFSTLADDQRVDGTARKVLLRGLARRHLPAAFDVDRKQGFSLPLHAWQSGRWGDAIADIVRGADGSWLSPAGAEAILASQRAGRGNTQRLFSLAMLELWRQAHDIDMVG
jgi:asparagine synthase (glutamine-hydrolysing)